MREAIATDHWLHGSTMRFIKRSKFFPRLRNRGLRRWIINRLASKLSFLRTALPWQSENDSLCDTKPISGGFHVNLISMQGCATREVHEQGATNWQYGGQFRENSGCSGGELHVKVISDNLLVSCVKELRCTWVIVMNKGGSIRADVAIIYFDFHQPENHICGNIHHLYLVVNLSWLSVCGVKDLFLPDFKFTPSVVTWPTRW